MSFPGAIVQGRGKAQSQGHHSEYSASPSYLFYWQLFESRQGAGEEANDKGSGGADNIQHGGWEHRDVCMLPGEGVEQSHYCVTTLRQCAVRKRKEKGNAYEK